MFRVVPGYRIGFIGPFRQRQSRTQTVVIKSHHSIPVPEGVHTFCLAAFSYSVVLLLELALFNAKQAKRLIQTAFEMSSRRMQGVAALYASSDGNFQQSITIEHNHGRPMECVIHTLPC